MPREVHNAHRGIFYDAREFLGAVQAGQIDRLMMEYMLEQTRKDTDLGERLSKVSDLQFAAELTILSESDTLLREVFDAAVEKFEAAEAADCEVRSG